ncbi:TCR/Tet family MFS transporter [Phenylobacterium immobile]|uniref:TCR/Tet family MFS transporter n=1 Tax=Phenylobacterium immobile TaxID=21 RepID=UPI000AFCF9DE|nr:TCR/Tet family MFS transporter [Phenylobacterium immobile]
MSLAHGRAATAFILVTALLDILAMGLVIPVLPALIRAYSGTEAHAGVWNGVLIALWASMQFVASPIIGALSDRYGRRPVILVSVAGMTIDWVLMALAPDLWWLAAGRMIGGITSSSFTTVYAYVADVTAPEGRARAYGFIGAAFSAGFVAGPALGGFLGEISPRAPFWAAAAMSGIAFLYGAFVLPESLARENRTAFAWSRANPFGALKLLGSQPILTRLAGVNFLLYFAHHVFSIFVLYASARYGWSALQVGVLFAFVGLLDVGVQAGLVGPVVKRLGEKRTVVVGLAFGALGLASMGLAPNGLWFIAAMIPNSLWGVAMPPLQSLMTQQVSESEQGQLQGANNSVSAIAGVASPLVFGFVYAATAGPGASAPFIGASFVAAAVVLAAASGVAATAAAPRVSAPRAAPAD